MTKDYKYFMIMSRNTTILRLNKKLKMSMDSGKPEKWWRWSFRKIGMI